MPRHNRTYRISDEAFEAIVAAAKKLGCSQAEVIERWAAKDAEILASVFITKMKPGELPPALAENKFVTMCKFNIAGQPVVTPVTGPQEKVYQVISPGGTSVRQLLGLPPQPSRMTDRTNAQPLTRAAQRHEVKD